MGKAREVVAVSDAAGRPSIDSLAARPPVRRARRGAAAVEYSVIIAGVVFVILITFGFLEGQVSWIFEFLLDRILAFWPF